MKLLMKENCKYPSNEYHSRNNPKLLFYRLLIRNLILVRIMKWQQVEVVGNEIEILLFYFGLNGFNVIQNRYIKVKFVLK